jgi:hypothetical protein
MWTKRNAHCKTWNTARKLKILENGNTHCRAWNMERTTEKRGK